jgi:hypothetical protein
MTSIEEQLISLNGEWRNNGFTWSQFGDFSEQKIADIEKEWFPNSSVHRGQLYSVWKNHPRRQQGKYLINYDDEPSNCLYLSLLLLQLSIKFILR